MNKEKKTALLLYGLLGLVVIASGLWLLRPQSGEQLVAKIQVGNEIIWEETLTGAREETFSIQQQTGLPITFEIKQNAIRFVDSDCPDKVCVHSGFLKNDMDIASCLPNQTVLYVEAVKK